MEKWSPRICLAWESIWYSSFGIQVIIRSFSNRSHPRTSAQKFPALHLKNIGRASLSTPHWGKNGKFSLKIEKLEVKIAPIFGFNPLIDTLAYPKIPFFRSNLVWFGLGALLKMWKISKIFTLVKNCFKNIPIFVTFLALASLVELHWAKSVSHLKGLTHIFQMALPFLVGLAGSLTNLKKSAENLTQLIQLINFL